MGCRDVFGFFFVGIDLGLEAPGHGEYDFALYTARGLAATHQDKYFPLPAITFCAKW